VHAATLPKEMTINMLSQELDPAILHNNNNRAGLPVRDGGLGIRRVSSLALPAFVASAASTLSLQSDILSGYVSCDNNFLQSCLLSWSAQFVDIPEILPTKQPFWDRPGLLADKAVVESSLLSPHSRVSFLAAFTQHSGDQLFALPIASCGLHDEAVRVAVGLRLGLVLCSPHECRCGSMVDAGGLHSFVCKKAPGKTIRHHSLNDLIARSFSAAGVLVAKEPTGLSRSDGKHPDGLSLVPWQNGKALCWDVTVICPLADSYISADARDADTSHKELKYAGLDGRYVFGPIAFENLGVPSASARQLLSDLGRRLTDISRESRETSNLFQRFSVLVQRFNAVLLHDSLPDRDCTYY